MPGQSHLFVAAPVGREALEPLRALLGTMTLAGKPGQADPANDLVPFGRIDQLHLARFVLLEDPSLDDRRLCTDLPPHEPTYLALLADGDGTPDQIIDAFVSDATPGLRQIFAHCEGFGPGKLGDWMRKHRCRPAALYNNWPGRSARQIREEAALHAALQRAWIAHRTTDVEMLWSILRDAAAGVSLTPIESPTIAERAKKFVRLLSLPVLLLLFWPLLLIGLPFFVLALRSRERSDPIIAPRTGMARNRMLSEIEDHDVTNQYSAMGSIKPGRFRGWLTVILLWIINWGSEHIFTRGRLGRVNTIHCASWTFVDDRRRVFFASNYDGSREAYNDDFINKVAFGLNLSFSNGLGYPRTDWLIFGGARHEQDFKRYLFHHQLPSQVWYNAFPGLTTYDMARNANVRRAFEAAPSGSALNSFLAQL
jgi:hypothetical protein